ncbi:MAG TPA: endopeptidase La [Candidatus Eisenbacteria bacterium]|nr:endopeptidase La [Candidatus Eisenbacteria bacterium]
MARGQRIDVRGGDLTSPPEHGPLEAREMPVLPVRHTVLFPFAILPLNVGRERSVSLLNEVMAGDRTIAVVAQKDPSIEEPGYADLHEVGSMGTVLRMVRFPDGRYSVLVQGVARVRMTGLVTDTPYLKAHIEPLADVDSGDVETQALSNAVIEQFERVVSLVPTLPDEAGPTARAQGSPGRVADFIASLMDMALDDKQKLLESVDVKQRLKSMTEILARELQVLEVGQQIRQSVQSSIDERQREFLLRQQLEAIRRELGETDDSAREVNELAERVEKAGMPPDVKKEADRELARLRSMPPQAAEFTVARTYLEWLADMPWTVQTEDQLDVAHVRKILDEDHFGLEKIKERILEYLVVRRFKTDARTPILCFVGPPGVGKTSLGQSIARALGRKFVRISLGGVRDEAEIRGHRRTYIGALPGNIVRGLRRAGTRNPVFMLDEVDKLASDFRGDPSSALLEVLDPAQNDTFTDHYLDVPFDLSQILFVTTANMLDTIPPPLRDRMEVIGLTGYTDREKLEIARRHLIPRAIAEYGLAELNVTFTDDALLKLINDYTSEAGLRNLSREIGTLLRRTAKEVAEGKDPPRELTPERVRALLGPERFHEEPATRIDAPGAVLGLAWTPVGGEVLTVEAALMPGGNKQLILTGQLGEVMRESAQAALTWVRSHSAELGIHPDFMEHADLHVHLPAGAIPKDGPSAGITLATAIVSIATGRIARSGIAMTGEITLHGQVMKIGGLKEKVLGAHRAGIRTVILPKENQGELEEVPVEVRTQMIFVPVERIEQVLDIALEAAADGLAPRADGGPEPEPRREPMAARSARAHP